jgi:diguanylate cyclase (GGDEF)-like protein
MLIGVSRLAVAALTLVCLGRLLRTARIYLSWSEILYYGMAWLALAGLCALRLLRLPADVVVGQVFETLFFLGGAGSLLEHVRADRRRYRDSRRLMEQWRTASGLARQRAHELEVLAAINAKLVARLELPHVLQAVVDHALRLASADSVAVYLVDGETGTVRGVGVTAVAGWATADLPAPRALGLTVTVARERQAVFVEQAAAHPLFQDAARPQLGAVASVPLKFNEAVVGVLNVAYRRPHVFDDDERRMLLGLADISALAIHNAAHHERLARLAVTDDLTGLPNRRRFVETLRAEAQRARRYGRALSLLMLDLDGLKAINDQHGHAAGDAVLRGVARALRASLRDTDLAARLSGDEFAVILPETEAEAAVRIAERIRAEVAAGPGEAGAAAASVSVGVVSAEGSTLPDLPRFLRLADEALYQSKAAGRNTIRVAPVGAAARAARAAPARSLTSL